MMHPVRKLHHPITFLVISVLVVIGIGVGTSAVTGNAALVSTNIAPSVLATIAGEQAFAYSIAPAATVRGSPPQRRSGPVPGIPRQVIAAQLLEIRAPITKNKPMLVWAIQESLPGRREIASSATLSHNGKALVAHTSYNFQVDFVSADSGKVVFSTEGYAPNVTIGG